MNIGNIFKWSYWFYQPFVAEGNVRLFWIIFSLTCILAGLVFKVLKFTRINDVPKKILYRLSNTFLLFGLGVLLWFMFRQQGVALFAFRFWLLVLGGLVIWRVYAVIGYVKKRVPEIKQQQVRREVFNKYLPHSKT